MKHHFDSEQRDWIYPSLINKILAIVRRTRFQSIDVILIDLVLDSDWQMNKYQLLSNEIQIQVGEWSEIFYFACSYSIDQIITYRRYRYFIIDRCFFCRFKNGFTSFQNFYITKYDHFVHFRCSMVSALSIRNPT